MASPADRPMLCIECEYVLEDLVTHRCPECGRSFDPARPSTFKRPPRPTEPLTRRQVVALFSGPIIAIVATVVLLRVIQPHVALNLIPAVVFEVLTAGMLILSFALRFAIGGSPPVGTIVRRFTLWVLLSGAVTLVGAWLVELLL